MRVARSIARAAVICALSSLLLSPPAGAEGGQEQVNLLSWGAGALVVQAPLSYSDSGDWSPAALLDELPKTGWATRDGDLTPNPHFSLKNCKGCSFVA